MRRDTKRYRKAAKAFQDRIGNHILANGGRLLEPATKYDLGVRYTIDTPAGELRIVAYDGWIAQRFEDVKRGLELTKTTFNQSNRYSGKCNFHYAVDSCADLECDTLELDWQLWLRRILAGCLTGV